MMTQRLKIEIDTKAIEHNTRLAGALISDNTAMMAVVKADGYGHGIYESAKAAIAGGAAHLGVATSDEGLMLRRSGIAVRGEILILGAVYESAVADCVNNDISQTVHTTEAAEMISAYAAGARVKAKIHIKLDTGMSRLGFFSDSSGVSAVKRIAGLPNIEITGIYSHFAESDNPDKAFSNRQAALFTDFCGRISDCGINIPLKHMANSAAAINLPEYQFDIVRLGILLYGLSPSYGIIDVHKMGFLPAMTVRSEIVSLKTHTAGTSVSYGRGYFTEKDTLCAVIPVGYADAYPRSLSNKGHVLINGVKAPIMGSICMDQMMVDASEVPNVRIGDEVTLIGKGLEADGVAHLSGTIGYELVCALGRGKRTEDRGQKVYV
jgi:alanine racemase